MKRLKGPLVETTETLKSELDHNKDTIQKSNDHVRNLKYQADRLDEDFERSRTASEQAVGAATAYQKITDALNDAHKIATDTRMNSENATAMVYQISFSHIFYSNS